VRRERGERERGRETDREREGEVAGGRERETEKRGREGERFGKPLFTFLQKAMQYKTSLTWAKKS